MGSLRAIDALLERLLAEDDLVKNKVSQATYVVKKINPTKHELVKPNMSAKEIEQFEKGRTQARAAAGEREFDTLQQTDSGTLTAIEKIPVPKDIGPENKAAAVGSNPRAEKQFATRMAQLGKASADYMSAMKSVARELKQQKPDLSEDELLAAVKAEVKKRGVPKPPSYDLCAVSVPGTNLFCGKNKEIPRDDMPQLKTTAVPGTPAWKKAEAIAKETGADPNKVEVNAEGAFLDYLKQKNVEIQYGQTMAATEMKATQNQLNADKVAGMAWALYSNPATKDPKHPLRQALIVSNDGYVLDGHHRWAALATNDIMQGNKEVSDIPVIKVQMDIEELVSTSNEFGDAYGLTRKGMGAGADKAKK